MRRLARVSLRLTRRFVTLVLVLTLAGETFQAAGDAIDGSRHAPPGRLVEVGGYRLHIYCAGRGSPAVILESGLGGTWSSWRFVQPAVARVTRVCSYDRAGLGSSDSGPFPRTSSRIARELHTLLNAAPVHPPYILVAQSFGGYDVRLFAAAHPKEVKGVVLVDTSHEAQFSRLPGEMAWLDAELQLLSICRLVTPFGLVRIAGLLGLLPRDASSHYPSRACTSEYGELVSMPQSALEVEQTAPTLGHVPLIVLSRGIPRHISAGRLQGELVWRRLQNELADLSTNSRHEIVTGSGHVIQHDRPQAVIRAVVRVVRSARAIDAAQGTHSSGVPPRGVADSPWSAEHNNACGKAPISCTFAESCPPDCAAERP